MKIYVESLGCVKNQVDSEMILALCKNADILPTTEVSEADILLVNTCGFIESAKKEAIDTILDLAYFKKDNKKLVVVGCLAQRYKDELLTLLPEVDRIIRIDEYKDIANIFTNLLAKDVKGNLSHFNRIHSTANHFRYVKISEGCTNRCAFCAIPLIRGTLNSRPMDEIQKEVSNYVSQGVKEINLISQDTTKYGYDLYKKESLIELLDKLCNIEGDFKIRLLYLYPTLVSDELINFIKDNDKVMPYFDIPIQHTQDNILKLMNRRGTKEEYKLLFKKIREKIPHAILRTTFILGFPHETKEDVSELIEFIKDIKFDKLGCFPYSPEEDTKGYDYPQDISQEEKEKRCGDVMQVQQQISLDLNLNRVGNIYDVYIEDYDELNFMYVGRSYEFAPDGIDGAVYVVPMDELKIGDVVKVKIVDADEYTLTGQQMGEFYEED